MNAIFLMFKPRTLNGIVYRLAQVGISMFRERHWLDTTPSIIYEVLLDDDQ